jgi:hypothetical protein
MQRPRQGWGRRRGLAVAFVTTACSAQLSPLHEGTSDDGRRAHASQLERIVFELRSDGPCLGLEGLSPPFSEQAFAILADSAKAPIWEYVPYYFGLAGGPADVEDLKRFVREGVSAAELAPNAPIRNSIFVGLGAGITGVGLLAARLEDTRDAPAADAALEFLDRCMDPLFWLSGEVGWRQPSWSVETPEVAWFAGKCVAAAHVGRKARAASQLERRRAELQAAGRLSADLDEIFVAMLRRVSERPPVAFSELVRRGKPRCPFDEAASEDE